MFRSGRLAKKHDYFHCIDRNLTPDTEEMKNLRGNDADKPEPSDAAAEKATPVVRPAPIRKPDPSVRELRRQISFGSGTGFGTLGQSIKKKTPGIGTAGEFN